MTHDHAEQRVYGDFLAYARENGALIAPPGRFAEHARGLLDSRLTEEPEGVRLQLAPGVEADGPRAFRSADPAR
jgi:hypothetical protein